MVDVVDDPHRHSPAVRLPQGPADHRGRVLAQVEVVLREVERALRRTQEFGDVVGDL